MFILFFTFITHAGAVEWPRPDFKRCEFYLEVEEKVNCMKNGSDYLSNYGFYYCNEFKKESKNWSEDAKKWVSNTGQCLQEMIYDNKSKRISPCSQLEEFAFDAHPICYKQYKICDLKMSDIYSILSAVRAVDYATRKSLSQVVNVGMACLQQYFSSEEKAAQNRFEASTSTYNRSQRESVKSFFTDAPTETKERQVYFKRALNLLLSSEVGSGRAADVYVELYGQTNRPSNDESFLECGRAMGSGASTKDCDPELLKRLHGIKKNELKNLSPIIPFEKMQLLLKSLKNRYAVR